MKEVIEFINGFNVQTIIIIGVIVWYFFNNLKNEMKLLEEKIDKKIDKQAERSDKLYEMFIDLLKRKNGE
jgi:hypothetical protein